jgi:serine/threonine protein kinase
VHGISQNPDTKDYIMVLDHARGGNFENWIYKNYNKLNWLYIIKILSHIISGLNIIHKKNMFHRDFHTGNILVLNNTLSISKENIYISDMGLCGEVNNTDETTICGVTPYIAPEVLRGNPYTQAADIYSFGMIMYFVATGRQPFSNCAHDEILVLDICQGARPKIRESEAPKCYVDLMEKCWDSNPNNRPNSVEVEELINLFYYSYSYDESDFKKVMSIEKEQQHYEIKKQFMESEEYRKAFISSFEENGKENLQSNTHPEAIYTSQILNSLTKDLQFDDCLECEI